jgi:colanic acid biosynthesis glycosyl transferase WcaI
VKRLRIQLWSYNYDPEPTGIGPVSTAWAQSMRERGHVVEVVAAHPHYPAPAWGRRLRPYRELRDGISVLRLPLWVGRSSTAARMRQELSYTLAHALATPALGRPDVLVAVSPSFPALAPAIAAARLRRVPWVLWLQDILPDGAVTTGLLEGGPALKAARALEAAAYRSAGRIVVISETFRRNLLGKGVPEEKLVRIPNPATRAPRLERSDDPEPHVLSMGNIGHSQGLAPLVRAFQQSERLASLGARLVVAGDGVAAGEVREAAGDRVDVLGVVSDDELERELARATLGLVSQRPDVAEFNLPSKLANFLAYGLPVVVAARPDSEAARLVADAGAGVVAEHADPGRFVDAVVRLLGSADERERMARAGREFADRELTPAVAAAAFERVLAEVAQPS